MTLGFDIRKQPSGCQQVALILPDRMSVRSRYPNASAANGLDFLDAELVVSSAGNRTREQGFGTKFPAIILGSWT
jgi:hypothetical protein